MSTYYMTYLTVIPGFFQESLLVTQHLFYNYPEIGENGENSLLVIIPIIIRNNICGNPLWAAFA
jgi:hypothetical protein